MTRSLALLLLLFSAPLAACGYNTRYEGTVVDQDGVARQGLVVSLADVGFAGTRYTDADTIARTTPVEVGKTDEQGHFALDHYESAGFGCGVDDQPALVISDGQPLGAVAVVDITGDYGNHRVDIGQLALPSALAVATDADRVHVTLPAGRTDRSLIKVDGRSWFAGTDGVLPAAALAACPKNLRSCAHQVSLTWSVGGAHLRSAITTVDAGAPRPEVRAPLGTAGLELNFTTPMNLATIYVDGMFTEEEAQQPDFPSQAYSIVSVQTEPLGAFAELPGDACAIYGTGLKCTPPRSPISAVSAPGGSGAQLRLFAQ